MGTINHVPKTLEGETLISDQTEPLLWVAEKEKKMGSDSEAEKSQQKEREKKKMLALAPIARPLAGKKLCKRTLKLVRRGIHMCVYIWMCVHLYSYISMNKAVWFLRIYSLYVLSVCLLMVY